VSSRIPLWVRDLVTIYTYYMSDKNYFVYIATNNLNTVFYTGVTNDLEKRIFQHANKMTESFTAKYNICKVVYYELFTNATDAITREKQIKKYRREKKLNLIRNMNANFQDLLKK